MRKKIYIGWQFLSLLQRGVRGVWPDLLRKGLGFFIFILAAGTCFSQANATTYYIANNDTTTNASDSNTGKSKTSAWLHAPGMTNCTATCAATTPQPGDSFIFRGGDTWHKSTGTPIGLQWLWTWFGSSGNPIYIGVDKTWYSGPSWTRPVLTMDNPTSTSEVASCKYDDSSGGPGVGIGLANYVILDNFEFTGMCWSIPAYGGAWYSSRYGNDIIFSNNYYHGWTHTACPNGDEQCDDGTMIGGSTYYPNGPANNNVVVGNIINGSDTDGVSGQAVGYDGYDVHDNIISYVSNGMVSNNVHTVYNNIFHNINNSYDATNHSNALETNCEIATNNYVYNNIFYDNAVAVNIWTIPAAGQTDYYFNNVIYNIVTGESGGSPVASNCWLIAGSASAVYFINNTIDGTSNGTYAPCFIRNTASASEGGPYTGYEYFYNNHLIGYTGLTTGANLTSTGDSGADANIIEGTDLYPKESDANTQGYLPANNYAPASSSGSTIAAGQNLPSLCPTCMNAPSISMDLYGTDRPYNGNGNWDIGAYEYFSSSALPPTVSLTTDQSSYITPATVVLTATAVATTGANIATVAFYNGPTLIASTTPTTTVGGNTFTYTWSGVTAGTYSLTAVAYDSNFHSTTSTPVSVTVNTSSSTPLYGDVNGEGVVTIYDAELTAQYVIGLPVANFNPAAAEVDGKGNVDIYDAYLIAEYAVKAITKFPAQQ